MTDSMHKIDKITFLLKRQFVDSGNLQDDEKELKKLLDQYPELHSIIKEIKSDKKFSASLKAYDLTNIENQDSVLEKILEQIKEKPKKRFRLLHIVGYAAACLLLVIGTYIVQNKEKEIIRNTNMVAQDFEAGEMGALLKLADGRTLALKGLKKGIVAGQDLKYQDGSKLLDKESLQASKLLTLIIPNGKEFQITLSDGTHVFLNAGSELTYPNQFSENIRQVQIKGEAYFEVAKDKTKPFHVKTATQTIEVLGTRFNLNEYHPYNSSVTLVEGKVKIQTSNKKETILLPNQHATIKNGSIAVKNVDVSEYIAWKNGEFLFNYENLATAMEKIKRWYDIEIEVAPAANDIQLWGSIKRKQNFAEVLKLIKLTNQNLKININGRKVTVTR